MTGYAEFAVTTNFSFLRGASHGEELVLQAKHLGLVGVDGEEVGRIAELGDEREFMVEGLAHLFRNAVGITPVCPFLGGGDQRLLGVA
jgi:hypothetical protein